MFNLLAFQGEEQKKPMLSFYLSGNMGILRSNSEHTFIIHSICLLMLILCYVHLLQKLKLTNTSRMTRTRRKNLNVRYELSDKNISYPLKIGWQYKSANYFSEIFIFQICLQVKDLTNEITEEEEESLCEKIYINESFGKL